MSDTKTSNEIKIDTVGKILEGDEQGMFIRVERIDEGPSFYIFSSDSRDFDTENTFDTWIEHMEHLKLYFKSSNWVIQWFES